MFSKLDLPPPLLIVDMVKNNTVTVKNIRKGSGVRHRQNIKKRTKQNVARKLARHAEEYSGKLLLLVPVLIVAMLGAFLWARGRRVLRQHNHECPLPDYLMPITGALLIHDYIDGTMERVLTRVARNVVSKEPGAGRLVAQYGGHFSFVRGQSNRVRLWYPLEEEAPGALVQLRDRFADDFLCALLALMVNAYRPHQGIGLHTDDEDYEEPVFVVSLEGTATLQFMEFDSPASFGIHRRRDFSV